MQSGDVFSLLAEELGITNERIHQIINNSNNVYDFASIMAGNSIQSFFDFKTNEFVKMVYNINENNYILIENTNLDIIVKKIKREYDIKLTKVRGIVDESFYLAGQTAGLKDKTIMEMADIFAWDIDFGMEVKQGDVFEFLYEKRFLDGQEVSPGKILIASYNNQNNVHTALYYKDPEGSWDYYDINGHNLRRQFLRSPINYRYISSGFSYKRMHPVWGVYTTHTSIDYAASCGTPVYVPGDGIITFAGWKNYVYGYTVEVRHNGVYQTRYSHLSNFAKGIKYGTKVKQGQIVAFVGTTGTSTGCHLDYGMKKYGQAVNPLLQKFDRSDPVKADFVGNFEFEKNILINLLKE